MFSGILPKLSTLLVKVKQKPFNITSIVVYASVAQNTKEEIDNICNTLDKVMALCKSQKIIIIMGNLYAKVRNEREDEIVGHFGLKSQNERIESWCQR